MDILELLLRDEENYRQGIYWCIQRGADRSDRLNSLLRRDRVYLIEIDGFDEFMAELHDKTPLALPKPIARPFDVAIERANRFVEIDNPLKSHPIIGGHIKEVLRSIDRHRPKLPLHIEAAILSSMGQLSKAIPIWEEAYEENPANVQIAHRYADTLAAAGRLNELATFIPGSPMGVHNKTYFLLRAGRNQEVIDLATEDLDSTIHY